MQNIKDFVVGYLQKEYTIPAEVNIMTLNYVESGYVNSLGLIQFIAIIEDEFAIEFEDEDLENPDIKIVGKLIEIIKSKIEI